MKKIARYSTMRGEAWLTQGTKYFGVVCHVETAPGAWYVQEFGRMSYEEAMAKFEQIKAELDGCTYVKPKCKFSANHARLCNSRNCPEKLGGAAYWQIFGDSCLYKHR